MTAMALYHPASEQAMAIETYAHEYASLQPGNKLELISLETPQGARLAELYGITEYPSLIVISNDGHLLRLWQGGDLPLMSELTGYINQ